MNDSDYASDPNTSAEDLLTLTVRHPSLVLANPALPLLRLEDPKIAFDIEGRAKHYQAEQAIHCLLCENYDTELLSDALLLEHLTEIPAMISFAKKPHGWDEWLELMETATYGEAAKEVTTCYGAHVRLLQLKGCYTYTKPGFANPIEPYLVPQWLVQAHQWYLTKGGGGDRYRVANLVAETARDLAKGTAPPHITYLGGHTNGQMARAEMTEKLLARVQRNLASLSG